jgi:hypothetical protein
MSERYERVNVHSQGGDQQQERIVVDKTAESEHLAYRVSSFIWLLFGVLEGLLGVRVFLKLIGANPGAVFARFIYDLTDIFLWPFAGLASSPSAHGLVLEISTIIAMLVYALIGWAIVKLTWLILYKP